jgi:hypothetical protein
MPMYFPDLKSVEKLAEDMSRNKNEKQYKGIVPKTEEELPQARKELAKYMREIWQDEIFALEIELAVSEKDYHEKMSTHIRNNFMKGFNPLHP